MTITNPRSDAQASDSADASRGDDFSDVLVPYGETRAAAGADAFRAAETLARRRGVWAKANYTTTTLLLAVSAFGTVLGDFNIGSLNMVLLGAWILMKIAGAGFVRVVAKQYGFEAPNLLALGALIPVVDAVVFWRVYCEGARQIDQSLVDIDGNRMNFHKIRGAALTTFWVGTGSVAMYSIIVLLAAIKGELWEDSDAFFEQLTLFFYLFPVLFFIAFQGMMRSLSYLPPLVVPLAYFSAVAFFVLRYALIWRVAGAMRYVDLASRLEADPLATPEEREEARKLRDLLADDGRPPVSSYLADGFQRGEDGLPVVPGSPADDDAPDHDDAPAADLSAVVPRRPHIPSWRRD